MFMPNKLKQYCSDKFHWQYFLVKKLKLAIIYLAMIICQLCDNCALGLIFADFIIRGDYGYSAYSKECIFIISLDNNEL